MADTLTGQVTRNAAEVYEEFFVPALFSEWTAPMVAAVQLASGQRVLDVACGTGVLARAAAKAVDPGGVVARLDRNAGMLAVARRKAPSIEWRLGQAERLPVAAGTFDAVVSQFGLMLFDDRIAALLEMGRVLRPGGRLAVAVWDALERSPGYAAIAALLQRLFGDRIANELRAPIVLGDLGTLHRLFVQAGISDVAIRTATGTARFPLDRILGGYGCDGLDPGRSDRRRPIPAAVAGRRAGIAALRAAGRDGGFPVARASRDRDQGVMPTSRSTLAAARPNRTACLQPAAAPILPSGGGGPDGGWPAARALMAEPACLSHLPCSRMGSK